jgi:transposase
MTAEIHKMPEPKPRLHCTKCHAEGPAPCACGPECLITVEEARGRRKEFAHALYKQGQTQEQIAEQLHVSQNTIKQDLDDFDLTETVKSKRPKTNSNPKGSGRPKGSKKPKQPKFSREQEDRAARMKLDEGKTYEEVVTATGLSEGTITKAVAREKALREADPVIDPSTLSLSTQKKIEIAVRQHIKKWEVELIARERAKIIHHVDSVLIPMYAKKVAEAHDTIKARRGVMTRQMFRLMKARLADGNYEPDENKLREMRMLFEKLEKVLVGEKDFETTPIQLPQSYEKILEQQRFVIASNMQWEKQKAREQAKKDQQQKEASP